MKTKKIMLLKLKATSYFLCQITSLVGRLCRSVHLTVNHNIERARKCEKAVKSSTWSFFTVFALHYITGQDGNDSSFSALDSRGLSLCMVCTKR